MTIGLGALFLAGLLASTLLPGGSEPLLLIYLAQQAPVPLATACSVVLVIGLGNTIGGVVTYGMGSGGRYVYSRWRQNVDNSRSSHRKAQGWLDRWGPWALLMSWVPIVGDPLCLVAGAMRLPFWRCVLAMAIGKFARYIVLVAAVVAVQT